MSGKKRGLSLEEKRGKVLEIFYESSDVFLFKDIEKLAGKKGVTFQSVKDVVQSLVDDDLVHQEKIGTSNFFWAFPSEASVKVENEHRAAQEKLEWLKRRRAELTEEVETVKRARDDAVECEERLRELNELKKRKGELKAQAEQLSGSDAALFEKIGSAIPLARDSVNRWQDNIHALQDWTKNKFVGREQEVDKFFEESGLTDAVDYVE